MPLLAIVISTEVSIGQLLVVARCYTFCKYSPVDTRVVAGVVPEMTVQSCSRMCHSSSK